MKKCLAILLMLVLCLGGCAGQTPPAEETGKDANLAYMGTWQIYTQPAKDGGAIGTVELAMSGEDAFSVEITDFVGGVDITGVKNAKLTEDGVAKGEQTISDDGREIEMLLRFTEDDNSEKTIVLDFVEPNTEHYYALESLYLYRSNAEKHEYKTLKIIDGAESGNLILAGAETDFVYTLDVKSVDIMVDGKKAEHKDLEDGMPIDIYYEGNFDNVPQKQGVPIDIISFCKSINGHSIGTKRNPGGTYYDLSGLYLKVLEDLWETDDGLNGNIKYISIDLSEAPGELTEGEKSAISYIFAKAHDKQGLELSFEELREQGYIEKDELYWEDGLLFSITDCMKAEEQYNGLRVIKFDAQKWRSGTGAYFFKDCTASWPQQGTWTDYNIGGHAIS